MLQFGVVTKNCARATKKELHPHLSVWNVTQIIIQCRPSDKKILDTGPGWIDRFLVRVCFTVTLVTVPDVPISTGKMSG